MLEVCSMGFKDQPSPEGETLPEKTDEEPKT